MHTRRSFLKTTAVGVTASLLAPHLWGSDGTRGRSLVVLQLAGGNDSLNTLVPYTDPRYRRLRPTLAIAERSLVPLSDRFALHPSLAPMKAMFDRGSVAIVDGVGFASIDRSHFRCQDVWHTADEGCRRDHLRHSGWLARYADAYLTGDGAPLVEVAIDYSAPLGFSMGRLRPSVMGDLDHFALPQRLNDGASAVLRELYDTASDRAGADLVRQYGRDLFRSIDFDARTRPRRSSVSYPPTRLGNALSTAAMLLDSHPATLAVWVTIGGFDTHARQEPEHGALLGALASAVSAFQADLANRGIDDRVLTLAWSEFGRRAEENASAGTDHGKGGLAFAIGARVRGGIHGTPPDLGALEDGDLPPRVDFRSLYATVIRRWFGRDPEPVLRKHYPFIEFL